MLGVFSVGQWPFRSARGQILIDNGLDYATASVSPVYSYNTQSPNIVELVAYWFASARNGRGTFIPPKASCWQC